MISLIVITEFICKDVMNLCSTKPTSKLFKFCSLEFQDVFIHDFEMTLISLESI